MSGNDDKSQPANDRIFKDPDKIKQDLLKELKTLGWTVKHKKNGKTGYKIRVFKQRK